jgi:hypothetical protein
VRSGGARPGLALHLGFVFHLAGRNSGDLRENYTFIKKKAPGLDSAKWPAV